MSYKPLRYQDLTKKMNHPWWHGFFTRLITQGFNGKGSYSTYYCKKCETEFRVYHEKCKKVEID